MKQPFSPGQAAGIVPRLLAQLADEQHTLSHVVIGLQCLRDALQAGNDARVTEVIRSLAPVMELVKQTRSVRARFQSDLADRLREAGAAASLPALIGRLPPDSAEPATTRLQQVRRLAEEMDQLHRENAALVYYGLDFLKRFLADMTGTAASGRYGPAGRYQPMACGAVVELQG